MRRNGALSVPIGALITLTDFQPTTYRTDALLSSVISAVPGAGVGVGVGVGVALYPNSAHPSRQNSLSTLFPRPSKGTMLLLEQSAHANSSPFVPQCSLTQPPQQPFSCDYLDVEADLANFVSEEDLKITQTALDFLANESGLLEMFQEPSNTSQNSGAGTSDVPSQPLIMPSSESNSHMDIQLPSFEETYSPSRFRSNCPDGGDFSFKFEDTDLQSSDLLIATSPDMAISSSSLQNDFGPIRAPSGFNKPRHSVPGYSSDNTSFSSSSSVKSYSGDASPPPPPTPPPCAMPSPMPSPSPTWSRRSSFASTVSMNSPLRETATPSRRGSTPSPASSASGPIVGQHQQQRLQQQLKKKATTGSLPCAVCGDNALCQHYGVRTCEGCKGFFKRTVQKKSKYVCLNGEKCTVDKKRRNRCQSCRFQKCLSVGMVKEIVRTDDLKGRRGRLSSKHKLGQPAMSPTSAGPSMVLVSPSSPVNLIGQLLQAHLDTSPDMTSRDFSMYQVLNMQENAPRTAEEAQRFYDLFTSSIEVIRRFVERIPGFSELLPEDRELLFTSSILELFALRLAFRMVRSGLDCDQRCEQLTLCNGIVLHRSQAKRDLGEWLTSITDFARFLDHFDIDMPALACFAAIVVTGNDRLGLKEPSKVEQLQMNVISSLREHLTYNAPAHHDPHSFSRLLAKLPDLRSISDQGLQRIFYLKHEELVPTPPLIESLFVTSLPF
ncbi:putative nuclear hormone receptor HR38-like [Tropilaelaps mercedesae]|uniref:Putative nuclear hormone receptor HR38-like n=1 Tax=Tropilaelaps mercedesae TaxID=418985 RepID=A0A1V9XW64_9ACAR|nr:putative nuclear hormone receptor HR38-like [Tropilaelaps mercedesae]